jgi:hypothetical protein
LISLFSILLLSRDSSRYVGFEPLPARNTSIDIFISSNSISSGTPSPLVHTCHFLLITRPTTFRLDYHIPPSQQNLILPTQRTPYPLPTSSNPLPYSSPPDSAHQNHVRSKRSIRGRNLYIATTIATAAAATTTTAGTGTNTVQSPG